MADVACPQCGLPIVIVSSLTGKTVSCPQCQFHFIMPAEPEPQASVPVVSIYQTGATRKLKPATSLLDIFDFRFEKFVTPIIIRITWIMVVAAAVLFAIWGAYQLVASELPVEKVEPKSQYELRLPKGAEVSGGTARVVKKAFAYGMSLILLALSLLWIRVSLEMTIVAFNIATSLQSIDRKTKG
jgi:hypothetical protein